MNVSVNKQPSVPPRHGATTTTPLLNATLFAYYLNLHAHWPFGHSLHVYRTARYARRFAASILHLLAEVLNERCPGAWISL